MRENKELLRGGTIKDRLPDGRPKPVTTEEKIAQLIEDWNIALECYKDEREETGTYVAMYALDGGMVLIREFIEELKKIQEFIEAVGSPEGVKTEAPLGIPAPGTVSVKEPVMQPGQVREEPVPGKIIYRCRARHDVDEETAKALNFVCPNCRMLLREVVVNE